MFRSSRRMSQLPANIDSAVPGPGATCMPGRPPLLKRVCMPALADAIFILMLLRILQLGATDLFNDPGTGWHLRTGHDIVAHWTVPRTDPYSITRGAQPWVETQWLGDAMMSLIYAAGGYPLLALATGVVIAGLFRWIYRTQVTAGGWPTVAVLTALTAAGAASIHFLARPLLATFIGVPLCFWWATEYTRGRAGPKKLWLLVPITVVWCNIHPGVLGGIATVVLCGGTAFLGAILSQSAKRRSVGLHRGFTVLLVGGAMGAATLINPYGLAWHAWIARLMEMKLLAQYVSEWKPLAWTDLAALAGAFLVAAGLIIAVVRRKGVTLAEGVVIAFWVTQGVQSARHVPLMALIVALQYSRLLAGVRIRQPWLCRLARRIPLFSPGIRDAEARTSGGLVSAAAAGGLALVLAAGVTVPALGLGTIGPPETRYSRGAIAHLRANTPDGPFFNDLNYGGTLIRDLPGLPVFVDDRFGLYGEQFVEHYCQATLKPEQHAARMLDRWQIETVLVGAKLPLARWLSDETEWSETYRDAAAVVYTRGTSQQEITK